MIDISINKHFIPTAFVAFVEFW